MAISQEMQDEINKEMFGLPKDGLMRAGRGQQKFVDLYTKMVAQMETDKTALINAGLTEEKYQKYSGYLDVLINCYGMRHGIIETPQDKRVYFEEQYKISGKDRNRMLRVAKHIVDMNPKEEKTYKHVIDGSGYIDNLLDVVTLKGMITNNLQYAAQIRPGNFTVDEAYCIEADKRATELLHIRGFVVEKGVPVNESVNRLNRIITLCRKAIADIQKWADAAFLETPEYYNENYVIDPSSGDDDTIENDVPANTSAKPVSAQ
jgi:hypothetical protein